MKTYQCPYCKQLGVPLKDKYFAGHWASINCRLCRARLCSHPIFQAMAYGLYTWGVAWWSFMAYFDKSYFTLIYIIPTWILIDLLNVRYVQLSVLRRPTPLDP